jgi:adenylyltransferase/sulfurtransferase
MGVGTIGIVDDDVVDASNLHRQTLYTPADVGAPKAARAAARLRELNPDAAVRVHLDRLTSANALPLFAQYDLVVDGSDNFPTRYLADDAAALSGMPVVWGAVHQYGGQAGVAWDAEGPAYRDLFPVPPEPGTVPSCAEAGVLPSVCAVIGSVLVTEVVKLITGVGEPLIGRVVAYDARGGGFRELEYGRDPERMPVTGLIDYEEFCGVSAEPVSSASIRSAQSTSGNRSAQSTSGNRSAQSTSGNPESGGRHVPPVDSPTANGDQEMAEETPDEITAEQLAALINADEPIQLLDVREPWEVEIAKIDGATVIPLRQLAARWNELDPAAPTVIYCHAGVRSAQARDMLRSIDFESVSSLAGGIDAWSREVDPRVSRY